MHTGRLIPYWLTIYLFLIVTPSQLSVRKGAAGNISLLNKFPSEASSAQLYLTATGCGTSSHHTVILLPFISALAK